MQQAPPEFWVAYRALERPSGAQVEPPDLEKLRALMDRFKLNHQDG
jgi:hypothetical protein